MTTHGSTQEVETAARAGGSRDRLWVFDTTLRDGEQSPGATMNVGEKVVIARQLEKLGVDVIEAGFAASSDGDADAVAQVAAAVSQPIVLSLARTRQPDIERAMRSVEKARRPGVHIFIATSDVHLERKLMMSRQEVIDAACWAVAFAKQHMDHIEFSAEDASRSDRDYLVQVFSEVIRAGASTLNVPDTTGYAMPEEFGSLFRYLIERTPDADRVIWSAHCHNDLGMAVANSLAAVRHGARQVECTINGIGERAGNTSLEEIVMAVKTRPDIFPDVAVGVVTEQIYPASRLLSQITGIPIPINKPIVGDNAFAHEAGIHQDGVLKDTRTYEIMRPESVGLQSNRLVLGKHSGRPAFVTRLKEVGIDLSQVDMNEAFAQFKALADKKKHIYDEDLVALVAEQSVRVPDRFELVYLNVTSSSMAVPHATVKLRVDGEERLDHGTGDGMVDACYKVIAKILGTQSKLERYLVNAITGGTEAQGKVSCLIRGTDNETATGHGVHTDIIMASALAYLNALNKLEDRRRRYRRDVGNGP
ncbi:MAG: 2-isopropylmalate synthase [Acidobacteria bacterium RBG_16_68_9]|nr:MAG: 2-isopropylmalate synthase [Acidobacteria bacterium RBG_16_68_9]